MKRIIITIAACSLAGAMTLPVMANENVLSENDGAEKVIYANFYTENGGSEGIQAIAVDGKEITYAGSEADADAFIGENTEVIDYRGKYALPGLIDGHNHAYVYAENMICDFNLTECANAEECIAIISDYIKNNPKDFYIGYGWLDVMFENGMPMAELLDALETEAPIYIKSEDCHSCWTNTAMMKLCGITAKTENPMGGLIEHLENGEPSGCFRDTAMDLLIKPYVPVYSVEQYKEILEKAMNDYIALGYTAYNDVMIDVTSADNIIEAYHQLDEEGKLKAYVTATYIVNNDEAVFDNIEHIKELSETTEGSHFKLNGVKFFMDGITESCTCLMSEPYISKPDSHGVDRWIGEEGTKRLYEAATLCNDLGLVAHFHAIGDAAVTKALDAMEYAKEHTQNPDIRNAMTHIQFTADEDLGRFAELGVIASCDLGWCYTDNGDMHDDPNYQNIEYTNLGEERVQKEMRYESLRKAGAIVAFATDFPATSTVNPFLCLEFGTNRYYDNIPSTICNPEEVMSVEDEIKAITENSAYQLYYENDFGKIEVGKLANFIILDQDITSVEKDKISETILEVSYIDGNEVYRSKN